MLSGVAQVLINRKQLLAELHAEAPVKKFPSPLLLASVEGWCSQPASAFAYWNKKGLKIAIGLEAQGRQQTSVFIFTEPCI